MLALIDESINASGVGTYVIGCVVVPHAECADLRRRLKQRGPFHFHKASKASRIAMLAQIGAWRLAVAGYVYRGLYPIGREGARQACLRKLLVDLRDWEVGELLIESRRSRENTRDAVTIIHSMRFRNAPSNLVYDWKTKQEPLLWLPDAVAGAVRAKYTPPLANIHAEVRSVS